jgi:glycosyltransferase involved in cell wall biosynthesis
VRALYVSDVYFPRDPEDRRMCYGALRYALAQLRHESFDLVHIHTPFVAHYAGLHFARKLGIPCIATYHTFFEEYLHHYVPAMPRTAGHGLHAHSPVHNAGSSIRSSRPQRRCAER